MKKNKVLVLLTDREKYMYIYEGKILGKLKRAIPNLAKAGWLIIEWDKGRRINYVPKTYKVKLDGKFRKYILLTEHKRKVFG